MMAIDDETLFAFVDGELDEVTASRIERLAAADEELRQRIAVQRRLRSRIFEHYAPIAEEEMPERFRTMLESPVVDLSAARQRRRWLEPRVLGAMAATLLVGLFGGQLFLAGGGPVALEGDGLVARGSLAGALETELASAPSPGAETRIGVSFADTGGRYCRTFENPALSGLACREGEIWRLVVTAPGSGGAGGDYRQAGGNVVVMQAAQDLMAGAPLDAEAERRLRDSAWANSTAAD